MFFLLKFQASAPTLLKVILLHRVFSRFLNCTKGTKSCRVSLIFFFLFCENWMEKSDTTTQFSSSQKNCLLAHQYYQAGLDKKDIQLNLCNICSILIFNEFYIFALCLLIRKTRAWKKYTKRGY